MQVKLPKNHVLFHEGDASHQVFRLVSGGAVVTKTVLHDDDRLGELRPGEYIGEMGVLIGRPRTATVTITEDSVLEQFGRNEFLHMIAADPAASLKLLDVLSLRTRGLLEQVGKLPDDDEFQEILGRGFLARAGFALAALAVGTVESVRLALKFVPWEFRRRETALTPGIGTERRLKRGEVLFQEGDASTSVYLIRRGIVDVTRLRDDQARRIGRLNAGEFVGEMGVLEARQRSATARALTPAVVTELQPGEFLALVQSSKGAYFKVIDSLCERAERLSALIRPEDQELGAALGRIESVAELAEQRVVNDMTRLKRFFDVQVRHGRDMVGVYQRYMIGQATRDELERANAYLRDYLKMAGLGTLLVLPGAVITIPLLVKVGKAIGVDMLPAPAEEDVAKSDKERRASSP